MKGRAWFCQRCQRILLGSPEHECWPERRMNPRKPVRRDLRNGMAVGVPHVLSVRKWCER